MKCLLDKPSHNYQTTFFDFPLSVLCINDTYVLKQVPLATSTNFWPALSENYKYSCEKKCFKYVEIKMYLVLFGLFWVIVEIFDKCPRLSMKF